MDNKLLKFIFLAQEIKIRRNKINLTKEFLSRNKNLEKMFAIFFVDPMIIKRINKIVIRTFLEFRFSKRGNFGFSRTVRLNCDVYYVL